MVAAQKVKEAEITEQDSLLLTRNLLRIAIFNISYIRGLFPEKYFNDKSVPALEMKIKKLMPMDAESRRLIDWMEKGVYDALQKKYLKTLMFCVCEAIGGPMIEEYTFSFCYSNSDSQEVSMNISRTGNKKGETFKCNSATEITPNQMRSSACKMVRTLVQLMRTLDKMPEERAILMKLMYYDDVTPTDYEPPFFRGCTDQEAHNAWARSPLKMEVGNVNSKHLVLALKVKSVLDPCEDENDDIQDNEASLGAHFEHRDESSDSDSEVSQSQEDQYIVAPVEQQPQEDNSVIDEDHTQDSEEDEHQLARVRDWISSHQSDTFELTDVLSNFAGISMALTEEIMEKLVLQGFVTKSGVDMYTVNKPKNFDFEFTLVKEEAECQVNPKGGKTHQVEDVMYMKALYHALPMKYVSVSKLQNELEGEANQTTVRKIIEKMINDGFIEAKGSRRLGKRVLHSNMTEKKLIEVKKALNFEATGVDILESHNKSKHPEYEGNGSNQRDMSTCGVLHSIGSDLTRMMAKSEACINGSIRSDQTVSKEQANTPMSKAKPAASRESFVQGNENNQTAGKHTDCNEMDVVNCTRSLRDQRCRKTSMVREPILHHAKRQRSEAV